MSSNIKYVVTPEDEENYLAAIAINNEVLPGCLAEEVNGRMSPKLTRVEIRNQCPNAPKKKLKTAYNASTSVRTLDFGPPPPPAPPGGPGIAA
jgi:hypothetical protein